MQYDIIVVGAGHAGQPQARGCSTRAVSCAGRRAGEQPRGRGDHRWRRIHRLGQSAV